MSNRPQDFLNCEATLVGEQIPDCEATIVGDESSPPKFTPPKTDPVPNQIPSNAVVTLVNKFLAKTVEKKATYIQIEPEANFLSIRYGQAETLKPLVDPLPKKFTSPILSQLKLMAELDINQCQTPQKGRIRKRGGGRTIHFFVQTEPSFYGEKMTIRVVDSAVKPPDLGEIISDGTIRQSLEEIMESSSGLVLVTGTDKKATTPLLYSLFSQNMVNPETMATVEESINYLLSGVSQREIDVEKEEDYPQLLQSLLQQDKSLMMVDNLPDPSVARMVAEMANDDRLILTSLNAEDGMSAIALLREMVTPSLLADTLVGVVHQHNLPRLCPACRTVDESAATELARRGISETDNLENTFYQARSLKATEREQMREKGRLCRECDGQGYNGSVQLYEFYPITPGLKIAIAQGADVKELQEIALAEQSPSLKAEAFSLLKDGEISLEEFSRVCPYHEAPATSPQNPTLSATDVTQRLEKMEILLMTLTEELSQLKQVLKDTSEVSRTSPQTSEQKMKVAEINERIATDIDLCKETIATDSNIYEELQDPGDWEALKQELDSNKETIVTRDLSYQEKVASGSLKSIPDPWS
ncbi:GspE/PulE family protein [Crocosphaera sp. Alani8]|uniref:GspE/PulE family protein n=1 Tax=Crocosphaera sp. Alani8 TaxID=3038952 RepID=UPI00313ABBFF